MQKIRLSEKKPIELNVRNLIHGNTKVSFGTNKIENSNRSSTYDQLRSSCDSNDHYTRINDVNCENTTGNSNLTENKTNEGTITEAHTRGSDGRLDRSTRSEHTYLTFSEDFPESANTDDIGIYSYATNAQHHAIRNPQRQSGNSQNPYLSLGIGSQKDYQTSTGTENAASNGHIEDKRNYPKNSHVQYDNNKQITASLNQSDAKLVESNHYDNTDSVRDNYLTPIKQFNIHEDSDKRSPLYTIREKNEYNLRDDRNSYLVDVRIPENSRKRSRSRVVIVIVVIMVILLVAAVSAVTVILTKSDGSIADCVNGSGCKCKRYPEVPNGHSNSTEDVFSAFPVRVTCDPGFKINETDTAFCQRNGSWNVLLRCEPMDCGKYQPLEHVRIMEQKYGTTFNNTVRLACETGFQFETQSDRSVWCNENGIWIGNPKCENIVEFSVQPSFILIGGVGKLTCNFRKTPNWQKIDLTRISSDNHSMVIVSIENLVDEYKTKINGGNIKISDSVFTHDSGVVVVTIDTIQCHDAFGLPGDVTYRCYVLYENSLTAFDERTIRIQGQPVAPAITISDQVVEGQDTQMARAFICEMYFPESNGHIIIESDYDGEISTLLTTVNGEYETSGAWIEQIKTSVENCWYRTFVSFGLKNVSEQWHRKHILCVAKPSDIARDQTVFSSESGVVKVIPGDLCDSHGKDILPHPYNCSLFVVCDMEIGNNAVKEVPAACKMNFCYSVESNICNRCDLVGGCSLTDIFFKKGNTYTVGSSLTIECIVEDFQGLEDIQIERGNGELVSSVRGDTIKGFQRVSSSSFLNATSGILSLYVDHLLCIDEETYRCIPVGNGKPSYDVIILDLNC